MRARERGMERGMESGRERGMENNLQTLWLIMVAPPSLRWGRQALDEKQKVNIITVNNSGAK